MVLIILVKKEKCVRILYLLVGSKMLRLGALCKQALWFCLRQLQAYFPKVLGHRGSLSLLQGNHLKTGKLKLQIKMRQVDHWK